MNKNLLVYSLFLLLTFSSFSQQSAVYTNTTAGFHKAMELYDNGQYLAAQSLFEEVKNKSHDKSIQSECAYYIAIAAVRLNQQNADHLVEAFVTKYPASLKRNSAYLDVANFYFDNGKISQSQKWFEHVNPSDLSQSELETYYFKRGYVHFQAKEFDTAKQYFNRVLMSRTYGSQAKYYLGYIAYEGDDYEEATELFDDVKGDDRYSKELSYYEADMNFKQGNFEKAIATGKSEYNRSSPQEKNQLSKIIGESYFNLELYSEAIPYLQEYRGTRGKWNNTDYYQLGYAYYMQKEYEKAIGEFNKIIDGKNAVSQNAYYHLAESYLKLDQKQQALNAFKHASEMDYSAEIAEDAFLNYAKLSYEIGNSYQPTPQVLINFIEKYPNNASVEEMKDLLIDSYITSKNYKDALELLETNKNFQDKAAYQKVAFYRGLELNGEGKYSEALTALNKSLSERQQATFTARATYWRAETNYELSNYREAQRDYEEFRQMRMAPETPEYKNLRYNLGYAFFKLKNYLAAIENFNAYANSPQADQAMKKDAYVRLGDSYFASRQYWPAMENYNAAMALPGRNDYAHFQKAISYGFVDRSERKIEELQSFIDTYSQSVYRDDAMYELGNTYVSQNNTSDAIAAYERLVREIPTSDFVPQTLMKTALLYDNSGNSKKALAIFKRVAKEHPSTSEALQAVTSAKNIYIDEGRVNEYATWVKTLDFVDFGDTELDDSAYLAAEQPYMENNFSQAKTRFNAYLKQFPNGRNALKAHFYLGQIYFTEKEFSRATPHFEFVVNRERNTYTEQALARISESYLNQNDYQNAQRYLQRLETEANSPQNIIFAQTNMMKASYELKEYAKTVTYAEKVLANDRIDDNIRSDAQVFIARSALKTNDDAKAKAAYAKVKQIARGHLAAEALYYEAYFKNKESDFGGSNASIQKLAKDYSGYKLFGAKGLVLMAKNFYALKDAFQATYILENVIENFKEYPEVVEEAKSELAKIKREEAKTNTSVEVTE